MNSDQVNPYGDRIRQFKTQEQNQEPVPEIFQQRAIVGSQYRHVESAGDVFL
jgi:hypothetical protein